MENKAYGMDSLTKNTTGTTSSPVEKTVKYFTPDIEDIRVGYECELLWNQNMLPEDGWYNIKIWEDGTEDFDIIDWIGKITNSKIRVPYLTKEQIEAEGWEKASYLGVKCFKKGIYLLFWFNKEGTISIDGWGGQIYRGQCKDINTFRYIMKLLGI